jgi:hypothetical protein
MRDRIERMRKIIALAHDQEMIAIVTEMIAEAEADIRKLEADSGRGCEPHPMPPQS